MSKIDPPSGAKARKRVLTPDELVAIWNASFTLDDPRGALVRLLMITLQRRSEVAGMPWAELSKDRAVWRIDGERAKNEHDHLVPLSQLAMAELEAVGWKRRGLVLPSSTGKTPVSNFSDMKTALDKAVLAILQKKADEEAVAREEDPHVVTLTPWRLHDLRRTGTTNLQALGFPIEVTERVINHHQGGEASGIRGIYNLYEYYDEKVAALGAWAKHLQSLITGVPVASNVVHLADARG
ncbi:site-specific integrase [Sphingobium chlorophenolicum]|nr:site-specific integrase [Sphingobium chlorophenolicum]